MAKQKTTIDYFPFYVGMSIKTKMFKKTFGNEGYGIWISLLNALSIYQNHYIDISDEDALEIFLDEIGTDKDKLFKVIEWLIEKKDNYFDKSLWYDHKIIYSPKFVDSLKTVYDRRKYNALSSEDIINAKSNSSKVEEKKSIVNNSKVIGKESKTKVKEEKSIVIEKESKDELNYSIVKGCTQDDSNMSALCEHNVSIIENIEKNNDSTKKDYNSIKIDNTKPQFNTSMFDNISSTDPNSILNRLFNEDNNVVKTKDSSIDKELTIMENNNSIGRDRMLEIIHRLGESKFISLFNTFKNGKMKFNHEQIIEEINNPTHSNELIEQIKFINEVVK